MRIAFTVIRAIVAAAIAAAIIGQLVTSIDFLTQDPAADIPFLLLGFFSFFTIESNVLSVVVLGIGAVLLLVGRGEDPRWFALVRVSVVTYMAVTGIVYNLLLRGVELPQGSTLGWSNEILHVVGPLYLVLDWLFAPGRAPLPWSTVRTIVVFPIVWAAYTLLRGPFAIDSRTGEPWYPYPFLNPTVSANGYFSVAFYVVMIAVIIAVTGAGAVWISRRGLATSGAERVKQLVGELDE